MGAFEMILIAWKALCKAPSPSKFRWCSCSGQPMEHSRSPSCRWCLVPSWLLEESWGSVVRALHPGVLCWVLGPCWAQRWGGGRLGQWGMAEPNCSLLEKPLQSHRGVRAHIAEVAPGGGVAVL